MKTMSEINKQKFERLKVILKVVKVQPRRLEEIEKTIFGNQVNISQRRTVQNYLAELKALDLIEYDEETKTYQNMNSKKVVFESKHDYELMLKHSKILCFSSKEKQRFDSTSPTLMIDLLVFEDTLGRDIDDVCFAQHLKTGYFEEVYMPMQKYKQLMEKMKFSRNGSLGEEAVTMSLDPLDDQYDGETSEELVAHAALLKDKISSKDQRSYFSYDAEYPLGHEIVIKSKELKEIYNLRDMLIGRIYSIVNDVRNGIPLMGYCDHCPTRKITIRDEG